MSWRASAYVKDLTICPNGDMISRSEKLVALILADAHQDKVGRFTYPSVPTIAVDALMDERHCRRVLDALERKGVITRDKGERQGRGQVTFYAFPELEAPAGKGGRMSSFFSGERGAKGGQKEGISSAPYRKNTNANEAKTLTPPIPPTAQGGVSESEASDAGKEENGAEDLASDGVSAGQDRQVCDGRDCAGGDRRGSGAEAAATVGAAQSGSSAGSANADRVRHNAARGDMARRDDSRAARPLSDREAGEVTRDALRREAAERILAQVCNAFGIADPRKRKKLMHAIELEMELGDWPGIGTRMIAARRDYLANAHLFRCAPAGPVKFYLDGIWKNEKGWPWDEAKLERIAAAGVGCVR